MELYASKATGVRFERHEIDSWKCESIGTEQVKVGEYIKKCRIKRESVFFLILRIGSQLTFPKMLKVEYV